MGGRFARCAARGRARRERLSLSQRSAPGRASGGGGRLARPNRIYLSAASAWCCAVLRARIKRSKKLATDKRALRVDPKWHTHKTQNEINALSLRVTKPRVAFRHRTLRGTTPTPRRSSVQCRYLSSLTFLSNTKKLSRDGASTAPLTAHRPHNFSRASRALHPMHLSFSSPRRRQKRNATPVPVGPHDHQSGRVCQLTRRLNSASRHTS